MSRAKPTSIKNRKISSTADDDQDFFDGLITLDRSEYVPGPTGTRMHRSLARTKIVRGGLGSGKSRCATEHINLICLTYPGALCVIARKDLTSLKETTQREFLSKVIDSATIEQFNAHENKLYYKNGSEVLFRETKDPDKFKSLELSAYLVDEADENSTAEAYEKLDERLRQVFPNPKYNPLLPDGPDNKKKTEPPYCGLLVFNPVDEFHWLYALAHRTDIDVEDFRFDTYENQKNLPNDYIPNLIKRLPPWDVARLVHGHWGKQIKGKPVIHGFKTEKHVHPGIGMNPFLPLYRGWDFGYNHPACVFFQHDPATGRVIVHRELLGIQHPLQDEPNRPGFASEVKKITRELCGNTHPVFDFGDPHGADKKDTGLSSIEYLRIHHQINVMYQRSRIITGLDEIQHKVLTDSRLDPHDGSAGTGPLLLVHSSCQWLIRALEGNYERDEHGVPIKDGKFDHMIDAFRYGIVNTMGSHVRTRHSSKQYQPSNKYTGYRAKR